jgi:hypothetical protein
MDELWKVSPQEAYVIIMESNYLDLIVKMLNTYKIMRVEALKPVGSFKNSRSRMQHTLLQKRLPWINDLLNDVISARLAEYERSPESFVPYSEMEMVCIDTFKKERAAAASGNMRSLRVTEPAGGAGLPSIPVSIPKKTKAKPAANASRFAIIPYGPTQRRTLRNNESERMAQQTAKAVYNLGDSNPGRELSHIEILINTIRFSEIVRDRVRYVAKEAEKYADLPSYNSAKQAERELETLIDFSEGRLKAAKAAETQKLRNRRTLATHEEIQEFQRDMEDIKLMIDRIMTLAHNAEILLFNTNPRHHLPIGLYSLSTSSKRGRSKTRRH